MRRFLLRVILFCVLQLAAMFVFRGSSLPGENNYLARTIEKHHRLRETRVPRIILVGGSNVSFGFVAEELNRGLGVPVVNMGLVAALGLEFMLKEIRGSVGPGDVVLLSPEYDFGGGGRDLQVLRQLLELRPESARFVSVRDWTKDFADTAVNWYGAYLQRAVLKRGMTTEVEEGGFRRDGFDDANCYVAHHGRPSPILTNAIEGKLIVKTVVHPLENHVFEMLAEFVAHCGRAGAICVYSCPPQPPDLQKTNIPATQKLVEQLKRVEGLIIIDSPEEHIYPLEQFYDTQYHLTKEGAVRRSRFIAERLQAWLPAGSAVRE